MKTKLPCKKDIICISILGLLPLVMVLARLIAVRSGASLITSEWNDELFYFKQVEAIIDYGYPRGYYGFNESHALSLSFAAWSPVLVWPWVLLGKIFGWTLTSVYVFNTVIYMAAMITFGLCVRPGIRQTAVISVWFFAFFLNMRYLYSCMPEVICFAHLIVFWGFILGYMRKRKENSCSADVSAKVQASVEAPGRGFIVAAIVTGSLMTFMRPYLILFLVYALFVLILSFKKGKRFIGVLISFAVMGITAFIYYLLNHYLSAEYLMPFFYTDFITTFFTDGFGAGVHNLFGTLYYKGRDFIQYMKDAFYVDRAAGVFFCIYVFMMTVQLVLCILEGKKIKKSLGPDDGTAAASETEAFDTNGKKERVKLFTADNILVQPFFCRLYMLFADFAFLMAILLMYKLTEGSKHLLTFIMVGVILMIMDEKKGFIGGALMSACVIWFGIFHCAGNMYDFGIPVSTPESESRYAYWQQAFEEGIELDLNNVPSYDNAVIWEFADTVDGEQVVTDWQMLYALPSGTGISCCWEYTADHIDEINCRYIAAPSGGEIDELCSEHGFRLIGRDDRLCVYARY